MLTRWKKWIAMILCAAMCSGMLPGFALAADAPATQKRNLALNQAVEVSGLEVSDGRFTGEMAVDGDATGTSRWSPAKKDNQWIVVDLGAVYSIDQIVINFSAVSPEYKVLVSETNSENEEDWNVVHSASKTLEASTGVPEIVDIALETPVNARYVKYQQLKMWPHTNGQSYSSSIYELEVYSPEQLEELDTDVNLALNRPVTATTEESGKGNVAANAVDGNNSTRWASNNDQFPQDFTVDLGQTCDLTKFTANFFDGATSRYYSFKIEASENGKDYTQIYDGTANKTVGKVSGEFTDGAKGRFVRLTTLGAKKTADNSDFAINSGFWEFEIYGPEPAPLPGLKDNLARWEGAEASASSVEKNYLGQPSGFTADKAVDGIAEKSADGKNGPSRWSPDKDTKNEDYEAWLQVDLGTLRSVGEIDIRFASEPKAYTVEISEDGTEWTTVATVENGIGEQANFDIISRTFSIPEPVIARYVRCHQTKQWKASNGNYYGGGIYELEVYQQPLYTAKSVLDSIVNTAPTIADGKLVLPSLPEGTPERYVLSLYGCDNQQIVTMDGNVRTPLVDMPVNVLYKVVNKENAEDVAIAETDTKFTVRGETQPAEGDNAKPNVIPGLREWKGSTGDFTLTEGSSIVLDSASAAALAETAKLYQQYFAELLDRDITVKTGTPAAGDVFLKLDNTLEFLGGEGYTMTADDVMTISSSTAKGVLYGGVSLVQVLYQDETHTHFPKGSVRDYPKYEVRSGMLDVGRMYIPLDYVKEMGLYMAWFKLNNLHMHINDYWKNSGYAAFRLESETYPSIVAKDGHYTKAEYKQFQKDLAQYGIEVITEIDSPYHAECFRGVEGVTMKAEGQLDIRTDATYTSSIQVIKNLMDEYLDGDDPVFQGNAYHIGTDEYDKAASEQMRKYTDELIKYTNGKGLETRVWASLGKNGFNGTTPVSNEATVNLWAAYWADVKETYDAGYNVINTEGGWLYIVPRSNAYYPDRIDLADRYNNFEVNNFQSPRTMSVQGGKGVAIMPVAHPQTKGAQFCIWNDMTSFRGGYSEFDVYDRFKNMVALVSEKTWYGEKSEGQTGAEFVERFEAVGSRAPGANPGRVVESNGDLVADINFSDAAKDSSNNKYDGILTGGATVAAVDEKNVLQLDGTGSLALPFGSLGYPYTAKIEVKLDADTPANTLIFAGADGELYANVDGTGHPGFKRGYHAGTQHVGYTFVWNDVTLPTDEWFTLVLTCDASNTTLYLNGMAQSRAVMTDESRNNGFQEIPKISGSAPNDSSTFILPVERIGANLKGELTGLKLYNRVLSAAEIAEISPVDPNAPVNVALGKTATASSSFPGKPWTPDKAVDGIVDDTTTKNSRWSSLRTGTVSGNPDEYGETEQWLKIDFGAPYDLSKITVFWEGAFATHYKLMGSLDDETYFEIKDVTATAAGLHTHDELEIDPVRYLKIDCLTPKTARYGYSIFEVEAYGLPAKARYAVTFETNGGSEIETVTVKDGNTVTKPTDPTKTGYTFGGWFTNEACTTAYNFTTPVTANITLYAKWTVKTYTVTFNTDGGSDITAATVEHGKTVTKPTDPTKTGYTFDGWFTNEACTTAYNFTTPVTENITLYAKWTVKTYTVTFNTNGGNNITAATVEHGKTVTKPTDPTKTGYTFGGWFTNEACTTAYNFDTPVTTNITLYAKWTVKTYTVTFNTDGGSDITAATVEHGKTVAKPTDPVKTGYTFGGWFTDEACTNAYNFDTPVTEDITLYAKWTVKTYTVTFNTDGGNNITAATVEHGKTVAKPTDPTKTGHIFGGWFTNEACTTAYNFDTPVTEDITLYAKWTVKTYTVTFNTDGGSDITAATVEHGKTVTKPTDPAKTGYTFGGWFTNEACTNAYNFDTPVTEDITLYAKWTVKTYTVTFNTDGGSDITAATVEHGKTVAKPADPTKDGYTFDGWFTDEALTQAYDFNTPVTADITLYVKWEPVPAPPAPPVVTPPSTDSNTETLPDGTTVTTETDQKTGTVTVTTKKPDGTTIVTETKTDGTVTTTETTPDHVIVETVAAPDGGITATVTLPSGQDQAQVTIPVSEPSAGLVAVIVNEDGSETIVPKSTVTDGGVALQVTENAVIKVIDNSKSFHDLGSVAWAQDAIAFISSRELFNGTALNTFSPNVTLNRGMLVTVLHRLECEPDASSTNTFPDVENGKYYAKAAAWAAEQGIIVGTGKGFEPEKAITREQLAVMLYRYAGNPKASAGALNAFADANSVSDWARDAMNWAVSNGILMGKGANRLDPRGNATRAEAAVMLYRFLLIDG